MKHLCLFLCAATAALIAAAEPVRNTVVLDANVVANLRLETASAAPRLFEETLFSLGRIEPRHGSITVVSSRIAGRVVALSAHLGDVVAAEEEIVRVESRQAGDPPPTITLRAPRAGTVTACEIHLGDPVEPDRHLLEITDLGIVEAVAQVPGHDVGRIRMGTTARIRLAAYPGEVFVGELVRLAATADPVTGTLAAHFALPNPDGRLRPGLRAEFSIVVSSRPDVLAVPRAAVQGEGGDRFVFIQDPQLADAFQKSPVVLGASNDEFVEVVSGIASGATVVTRGAYSLAFAGGGAVSLKEALDAAHGHEHAADGSELGADDGDDHDHEGHDYADPDDHAAHAADDDHDDHDHGEAEHAHPARPWQIATAVLALFTLVLSIALARRRHA